MRALAVAALALVGCRDLSPAIDAANGARAVGHSTAAVIEATCTAGYERAATLPPAEAGAEVLRLDRAGCPAAARAHDALRAAHESLVAVIRAIDAGQCESLVSRLPQQCDLAGAIRDLIEASGDLAVAVRRIQESSR